MTSNPIFVAIDQADLPAALALAGQVQPFVGGIKLGLEFFNANGVAGVNAVAAMSAPIFLDLKLHDIPNTVGKAVASLAALNAPPAFLTLHAQGGAAMVQAAAEARDNALPSTKLLAVTVLTSLDASDLSAMGVAASPLEQVQRLGSLAFAAGADGCVCSPLEVAALRVALGPQAALMVPGIRPAGSAKGDQKRVMSPGEAVAAGASHLVIGRPITGAQSPEAAARAIAQELGHDAR